MTRPHLRSIDYDSSAGPSLFERWERGDDGGTLPRPLAARDANYRQHVLATVHRHRGQGRRLISVGAGNGFMEAEFALAGWQVTATDISDVALELCRAKGLRTARFDLLADQSPGKFDVVYADGVMGHLWHPSSGCGAAWRAFAGLSSPAAILCVSNDLADTDAEPEFAVTGSDDARFFRPPAGWFGHDAATSDRWQVIEVLTYDYDRAGRDRRREIVVASLLVDDRVEPEH